MNGMDVDERNLSIAFQSDKSPQDYAELGSIVESYGFDTLSVYGDLLFQPPIVPLTVAAQATRRIRLGPASLNPYTLHPVEIAGQIAALDRLSEGRAYLGLSRGAWLDSLGVEQDSPITRLSETIDIVDHLLSNTRAAYNGKHFQLSLHNRLQYEPWRDQVPVLIGSWGRRTIRMAASRADEIKLGGSTNPDIIPIVNGWLREVQSDNPTTGIVMGAVTIVDDDRAAARRAIREQMALYLPVVARLDPTVTVDPDLLACMRDLVDRGDPTSAGHLIPDDLIDRFAFSGTPGDIVTRCEALFDTGATRIEFGTPHGLDITTGLRLLGEKVLPALDGWRR